MNKSNPSPESKRIESAAQALRQPLTDRFLAYHRQRIRRRILVRISTGLVLLVWAAAGFWWVPRNGSSSSVSEIESTLPDLTLGALAESTSADAALDGAILPEKYKSFKFEVLDDSGLIQSLQETQSDWFVATVDGEIRAFQTSSPTSGQRH